VTRLAAVTGATGFLGRYVVGALASAGWQVRILARRSPDHPQLAGRAFETVLGDLSDRRALDTLIDGADVVIHAAGLIKAPNAAAFQAVNVGGTANLVAALNDDRSSKHLVLVSSMVAREPQLSPYARTKRESEDALTALRGHARAWTVVRPCAVYGPWDRETLAIFRAAASHRLFPSPGRHEHRVALIHATDAAQAIVDLCRAPPSGHVFELTDRRVEGYSWQEIACALETAIGAKALRLPLPSGAVRAVAAVNAVTAKLVGRTPILTPGKAREILHADWGSTAERLPPPHIWQPRIGLSDGFRETASWYRDKGWLPARPSGPLIAGAAR